MTKGKKASAAILGFLDEIKKEGIETISEESIADKFGQNSGNYSFKTIDPSECKPWKFANRWVVNEQTCESLIQSIQSVGQQIPAIVRPVGKEYELICGARRRFVCERLGIPLKVIVVALTDKQSLLLMDAENRERTDISPYERAMEYKQWVSSKIFKNYKEAMEEAGFKKSWFSKLIALAELDSSIVKAFAEPIHLKQVWGYNLALACKNTAQKQKIVEAAKKLIKQPQSPATVYKTLMATTIQPQKAKQVVLFKKQPILETQTNNKGEMSIKFLTKIPSQHAEEFVSKLEELMTKSFLEETFEEKSGQ